MKRARLTAHQREVLATLARRSDFQIPEDGWILARDCGAPAALDHLYRKGFAERRFDRGPRGGEHWYYRPEGWTREKAIQARADRQRIADLKAAS